MWNEKKQQQLDELRRRELAGTLDELGKQMLNGLGTTVIGKLPVTICRDTNYQFAPNTFAFSPSAPA